MAEKNLSRRTGLLSQRWLAYYLDQDNGDTFFHATASAKAAGYQLAEHQTYVIMGARLRKRWAKEIDAWIDQEGLSKARLKEKLLKLLEAKETKFFPHETKEGFKIEERKVKALSIQQRTLDMVFKLTGDYAPEKKEFYTPAGIQIEPAIKDTTPADEAARIYLEKVKLLKGS